MSATAGAPGLVWLLTDGRRGNLAQAEGVAAALGWPFLHRRVDDGGWPRRLLAPFRWPAGALTPPLPDLVLSCGGRAARPALALRRHMGGRGFFVHLQNPRLAPEKFDLVAAPAHDRLTGPAVFPTLGSPGPVNRALLDAAAAGFRPWLAALPRPLIAVLVGGGSRSRRLDARVAADLARRIAALAAETGGSLLVTPSRRTGTAASAVLREAFAPLPGCFWDGRGDNPYFAYLGCADVILVTEDSVNMTSEACAAGKPVYVLALPKRGFFASRRLDLFHDAMRAAGYCRPFAGRIEAWPVPPALDEAARVAAEIRRRLALRAA